MRILKGKMKIAVIGVMVFLGLFLGQVAQAEQMTLAEFANILVNVLGLEMPAGADSLSDAEFFELQANMLAERGITLFVDGEPDTLVTRGMIASVLYYALIGPSEATLEEKIAYLAGLGYIGAGGADDIMDSNDVIVALNVPELSEAVAEAYGGGAGGPGEPGVVIGSQNPTFPEEPPDLAPATLTSPTSEPSASPI